MIDRSPTRISLVRHGDVYNPEKVVYGRLPGFRLSRRGRRQARAAAELLCDAPLVAIYHSPLLRAHQTAELLQECHPDAKLIASELLLEVHSPLEGQLHAEVSRRGLRTYGGDESFEQPEDIAERMARFVEDVRRLHGGQHVAAITHGDVVAFTVLWAVGEPLQPRAKRKLQPFGVSNGYPATASVTTLIYRTRDPQERPEIDYRKPY